MPSASAWLREAFVAGVDERHYGPDGELVPVCWLAPHDPAGLPCNGRPGKLFERFHFAPRQRVEHALFALLPGYMKTTAEVPIEVDWNLMDLIQLAAWDPRNAELACEHHHRRFDGHACSPRAPKIVVPEAALPAHVLEFGEDYGLRGLPWWDERFPA